MENITDTIYIRIAIYEKQFNVDLEEAKRIVEVLTKFIKEYDIKD